MLHAAAPGEATGAAGERIVLRRGIDHGPQRRDPRVPGPQERFLASTADICIYGGAAGGGKTWAGLYDPLRHVNRKGFRALFVREYALDIRKALWPDTEGLYPLLGGEPNKNDMRWDFPSGARIEFGHLDGNYQKRYRGPSWAGIYFEELADVEKEQFWYLISRNRTSVQGLEPYVRGNCNPSADSWLAEFLAWWWDPETGYAIPERAGKVRWMVKRGDDIFWGRTRAELLAAQPWADPAQCKSVQFIPATLADNAYLGAAYRGNLLSQDEVQRERLLGDPARGGNWKIRYERGKVFRREWFKFVEDVPADTKWVRAWDLAATAEKDAESSSSYTAGVKIGTSASTGRVYIGHLVYGRWDAGDVEDHVLKTAGARELDKDGDDPQLPSIPDGPEVPLWFCKERGGAGKSQVAYYARLLKGYEVDGDVETGEKVTRLGPLASQAKAGNVYLVRGDWNERYLSALERLPARPDDVGDASAAGFDRLVLAEGGMTGQEVAQSFAELHKAVYGDKDADDADQDEDDAGDGVWSLSNTSGGW